jgi:hypothetical protein
MRYFTPELFLKLNSSDSKTVDDAIEQWERAILAYKKGLRKLRREWPSQLESLSELSLHDWNLVTIKGSPAGSANSVVLGLKHNKEIVFLYYILTRKLHTIEAPAEWSTSKTRVHWLYDELHASGDDLTHSILLSDGTVLIIPFSNCQVWPVNAGRAVSHSELVQLQTA